MTEENLSPSAMPHDVNLTEAQKQLRDEILNNTRNQGLGTPNPKLAEINSLNSSFWSHVNARIDADTQGLTEQRLLRQPKGVPQEMLTPEEDLNLLTPASVIQLREWSAQQAESEWRGKRAVSLRQSARAKKRRPGRVAQINALFTQAMHFARADGNELDDFIDSAKNGSCQGICLEESKIAGIETKKQRRFSAWLADCPSVKKSVAYATLARWWTEADSRS